MDAIARRSREGAQESDRRTLAVGAGDMDDRRSRSRAIAQRGEQPLDPLSERSNRPAMERPQPRESDVAGRGRIHAALFAAAGCASDSAAGSGS